MQLKLKITGRILVIPAVVLLLNFVVVAASSAQEKSFDAEQEAKVKAYIEQQTAAGVAPRSTSKFWKKGYTCQDLLHHSWEEYRECRYYYQVNGRYFP